MLWLKKIIFTIHISIKFILYFICFCFLIFNTVLGVGQKNLLYPYIDTKFAKDFSLKKWKKIEKGMSQSEVTALLGKPLVQSDVMSKKSLFSPEKAFFEMQYTDDNAWISDYAWCVFTVYLDSTKNVILKESRWFEN